MSVRVRTRVEEISRACNLASAYGMQSVEHALRGDGDSAILFARDATRAALRAIRFIQPTRCCDRSHYLGETCATFGASASQIEVLS